MDHSYLILVGLGFYIVASLAMLPTYWKVTRMLYNPEKIG